MQRQERGRRADTSPVFGVMVLAFVTVLLTAAMGAILAGGPAGETGLYAGSAVTVDADPGRGELRVMVVGALGADHVDVALSGWGGEARVRLDGTGSSMTVTRERIAVEGGRLLDGPDDAVAPDGSFVDGPRRGDTVHVRVVGERDGVRRVILVDSGRI